MVALRSLVFNILQFLWTALLAVVLIPILVLPRSLAQAAPRIWTAGLVRLATLVCGIRYRVRGHEHLPGGACIVAAKHQSSWDTYFFHRILPDPVYVMKRELLSIPLVGWYMRRAGSVAIDRSARLSAIKTLIADAARALAEGRQIVVFPEGTRVAPGDERPYHSGVGALYEACNVPVVPVALDSGRLWGRRTFLKRPGVITVEILEPIPPGLGRRAFMADLRRRIETACERLAAEAGDKPAEA